MKPIEMATMAAPAAATNETTQPDAETFETARPRSFGRGKNGLRSTAGESKEENRYRMKETKETKEPQETKETKERNVDAGDRETKKAPKGADWISRNDAEKKSYYQPLPAKGSGSRGSGPKGATMSHPFFLKSSSGSTMGISWEDIGALTHRKYSGCPGRTQGEISG